MDASFTSNIGLKITSTINLYLRLTLGFLIRLVLSPFDSKTNIPKPNNTKDNIAKQQPTHFLSQIPSLQPPFPPLSASVQRYAMSKITAASVPHEIHSHSKLFSASRPTATRSASHLCNQTAVRLVKFLCTLLRATIPLPSAVSPTSAPRLKRLSSSTGPPISTRHAPVLRSVQSA